VDWFTQLSLKFTVTPALVYGLISKHPHCATEMTWAASSLTEQLTMWSYR